MNNKNYPARISSIVRAVLILTFILFSSNSFSGNNPLFGKWYEKGDPKSTLEFFEDNDLLVGGEMQAAGTWKLLSDGRLKINIDSVYGKMILLGRIDGITLILSGNNKTYIYNKFLSKKEIEEKAKKNNPNPSAAQKRDPSYVWNSPLPGGLKGKTSLHIAVEANDLKLVKELIKKGAPINAKITARETKKILSISALDIAYGAVAFNSPYIINNKNRSMVELLEKNGALLGTPQSVTAKKNQNGKVINFLVPDLVDSILKHDLKNIEYLVLAGAQVNYRSPVHHLYPLEASIKAGDAKVTKALLSAGANPNKRPILEMAIKKAKKDIILLLISYGADVNPKWEFTSPLTLALLMHRNDDVLDILKAQGAKEFRYKGKPAPAAPSKLARLPISELQKNSAAMKLGQDLFVYYCSYCHGSDARGKNGYPNLTDNDWLYGGKPEQIEQTIMMGRNGAMPAWLPSLGEQKVNDVANYVQSLSGRPVDKASAEAGKKVFMTMCIACHGADAKGNQMLGAANLTDTTWLHGGTAKRIKQTISNGRTSHMPAHDKFLGKDKVHLVAAYVYSLSHK